MKNNFILAIGCAAMLCAATCTGSRAQDSSQAPPATDAKKEVPASKKSHKVWTEDNVSAVRTPADNYSDRKQADEAAAAAAAVAATKQAKSAKPEQAPGGSSLLANPKSPEDVDRMVAWENRDIDAQEEFVGKLRAQLQEAAPSDKERIQKMLTQRLEIIAATKRERDGLLAQRKDLEKKAASSAKTGDSASKSPAP